MEIRPRSGAAGSAAPALLLLVALVAPPARWAAGQEAAEGRAETPAQQGAPSGEGSFDLTRYLGGRAKGAYKSGKTPRDLYRTIALGLDGTPMAGYGEALSEEQIWELVVFVRSIAAAGAARPDPPGKKPPPDVPAQPPGRVE